MYRPKDTSVVAHEQLLADHDGNGSPTGLGEPTASRLCSWKDYIVIVSCLISYTVAIFVVFVPKYAVYWGQNRQFIWVGLCLTLMGWCAQFPLRRLFLTSSTNSRASTLQSMDAILRSDPTTVRADWRVRILLTIMLGIGPALSASYKSLGGGQSQYVENDAVGQFGMIGPPGTQNIGFGISQFINATLPWFKDPGFPDRVYGFNMHVASENVTAMLDGPMPDYVESIQASLRPEQFKIITAEVSALVCEQRSQLSQSPEWFLSLYNNGSSDGYTAAQGQWVYNTSLHIAMMFPDVRDNTNIVVSGWSSLLNETFGHDLRQYSLSRQSYTGPWHVTKTSVELISAIRGYRRIDDRGLLSSNFLSFVDLYSKMLAEYDWRYRSTDHSPSRYVADVSKYRENIKSDSTFLASIYPDSGSWPELRYDINVIEETAATTIKSGWGISFILALNPFILFASMICSMLLWSRSPMGEGFGLVSLLASVEERSRTLLDGAGFSGNLAEPVFVGFLVGKTTEVREISKVTTVLGTKELRSDILERGTVYS